MNILVISSAFLPAEAHGGVPFSTFYLSRELVRLGNNVKVITSDRNGESRLEIPGDRWSEYQGIPVVYCKTLPGPYLFAPAMPRFMKEAVRGSDIIISSATLWNHAGWLADGMAHRLKLLHVVYTRGLLDPWAFKFKKYRKQLFWSLQGKRILDRATRIVALNESEKQSIRQLNSHTPIEVIPNGINPQDLSETLLRTELDKIYPRLNSKRYLLFMGRIHQKKGLDILLPAFKQVLKHFNDLMLVLAGPVESIYQNDLNKILTDLDIIEKVVLVGSVKGHLKNSLLHHASGFVLTSYSEGLPVAVLEALSVGCPVIISHQCNLPEINTSNAGWIVRTDINEATQAIKELLLNDDNTKRKIENGSNLAQNTFSWNIIGERTQNIMRSLLSNS